MEWFKCRLIERMELRKMTKLQFLTVAQHIYIYLYHLRGKISKSIQSKRKYTHFNICMYVCIMEARIIARKSGEMTNVSMQIKQKRTI